MKKTILVLTTGIALFTACKKTDTTTTTAQQKIMNKWTYESDVFNNYYSGTSHITTTAGVAGDYVDFRTDGKVYLKLSSSLDTSTYSILSDNAIKIDVDTFEIKTLTDNSFILYLKEVSGAGYYETTINLKK